MTSDEPGKERLKIHQKAQTHRKACIGTVQTTRKMTGIQNQSEKMKRAVAKSLVYKRRDNITFRNLLDFAISSRRRAKYHAVQPPALMLLP